MDKVKKSRSEEEIDRFYKIASGAGLDRLAGRMFDTPDLTGGL